MEATLQVFGNKILKHLRSNVRDNVNKNKQWGLHLGFLVIKIKNGDHT